MLEHHTIFISNCDFHEKTSALFLAYAIYFRLYYNSFLTYVKNKNTGDCFVPGILLKNPQSS